MELSELKAGDIVLLERLDYTLPAWKGCPAFKIGELYPAFVHSVCDEWVVLVYDDAITDWYANIKLHNGTNNICTWRIHLIKESWYDGN